MLRCMVLCLISALAVTAGSACQLKLDGASCPCADGWVCCAERQVCVQSIAACGATPDAGSGEDGGIDASVALGVQQLDLVRAHPADELGAAVAAHGDLIAIGAPGRDSAAPDAGAVELYQRRGGGAGTWVWLAELVAPDPQKSAHFGAALAFANDQLVVGAPQAGSDEAGKVYVYRSAGDGWVWGQTIEPDLTGIPVNERVNVMFGQCLAGDPQRVVIGSETQAHVYQLSEASAVHLVTLDPRPSAVVLGDVAIHGDEVVLATVSESTARADIFDAAQSWARMELPELTRGPVFTFIDVAFDGDRLALSNGSKLRIFERTTSGWRAPEELDFSWIPVTGVAWRGPDLVMTAYDQPHVASVLRTAQRIAGAWQVDDGMVIDSGGFVGTVNGSVAISDDWVVTGTPGARDSGVAALFRFEGATMAGEQWISLDDGWLSSVVAVGPGRVLVSNRFGPNQVYWFERASDGVYRRRPSLVTDLPSEFVRTLVLGGDHVLIHAASIVEAFELDHGNWMSRGRLAAPDPGAAAIALSGDTALVFTTGFDKDRPAANVYTWNASAGWALSSQLIWTGPSCSLEKVYLGETTAVVQCISHFTVFRRDGSTWQPVVSPSFPGSTSRLSSFDWVISGDRLVVSGAVTGSVYTSHVFRWTGNAWTLEQSVPVDRPPVGPVRGIVALDGDRRVVGNTTTSVIGERFVKGAWTADRTFELPAEMRSADVIIESVTLMDDQLILAVPEEEVHGRASVGALYLYTWPQ